MGKMDSSKGIPLQTGGKMPKGADAADTKGERHEMLRGGVAMFSSKSGVGYWMHQAGIMTIL